MICRVQENEGANTVDLKANLRGASLLQLHLLDRDHVIRLLLTPCGICHFNITLLFLYIFLLFLFFFPYLRPMFITHRQLSCHCYSSLSASWCSKHTTRQTNTRRRRRS